MPAPTNKPAGSPDDIIIFNGKPHSRAYALEQLSNESVPQAWIERYMVEAKVIFAQPESGEPVYFERAKPCHDELGHFAPCGSEAAEKGEKVKGERAEKKAKETEAKSKVKAEKEKAKVQAADTKEWKKGERAKKIATTAKIKAGLKTPEGKQAIKQAKAIASERTFPAPKGSELLSDAPPTAERSRVGVPAHSVPPPPGVPRLKNATIDERLVESRFANAFEANPDKFAADFTAAAVKDMEEATARAKAGSPGDPDKGIKPTPPDPNFKTCPTFETDAAKSMSVDYNPKGVSKEENLAAKGLYNIATHQTANAIAKKAFVKYLDNVVGKLPEEKRKVLVTSGGCGSGKGFAVGAALGSDVMGDHAACWDAAGEQNATENSWIMDECEKRGIRPTFAYIHANPSAWEEEGGGVVERAIGKGRMVDAKLFVDSYVEGAKNFKNFMDDAKSKGKNAGFAIIDNTRRGKDKTTGKFFTRQVDKFPAEALKIDGKKLHTRISNYVAATAGLPPAIVRGATLGNRHFKN